MSTLSLLLTTANQRKIIFVEYMLLVLSSMRSSLDMGAQKQEHGQTRQNLTTANHSHDLTLLFLWLSLPTGGYIFT